VWQKFTASKNKGGLGFRDLKLFNKALLARQAWRLIERTDSLCARLLKAKYFPNGNLLDTAFPTNQSPTWKAIVHGLDLLKKGVCWRIGRGDSVRIWRDPWIPRGWERKPIGKRGSCGLKWVSQLIDEARMEWREEIVYEYFRDVDVQKILSIRLPSRPTEDFISWLHEKSGVFQFGVLIGWQRNLVRQREGLLNLARKVRQGDLFGKDTGVPHYHTRF
jgi:hypothetical protein